MSDPAKVKALLDALRGTGVDMQIGEPFFAGEGVDVQMGRPEVLRREPDFERLINAARMKDAGATPDAGMGEPELAPSGGWFDSQLNELHRQDMAQPQFDLPNELARILRKGK